MDPRLILPQQHNAYPPYVYYERVLSPVECDAIAQLGEAKNPGAGTIGNGDDSGGVENAEYRKVMTSQLVPQDAISGSDISWLFARVRDRVMWANADHFRFDLHGLWQNINYLRYDEAKTESEIPGHYDWHQDFGGGESSQRKLSVVIQLSKPEDYDGCRLHLHNEREFDPGHVQQGDMVIFPSWTVHRVTPITRGRRRALVSWVSGPPLR